MMIDVELKLILIFKNSMVRSSLCDYSDAYILVSVTIAVPNTEALGNSNETNNNFKLCPVY